MFRRPFARRSFLALFGGTAVAARAAGVRAIGPGGAVRDGPTPLAAVPPSNGLHQIHDDSAQAGTWRWRDGDHRAALAADPLGGLAVRHASIDPSAGAWMREWDGVHGRAEWFGARRDDPAFDNRPAIQAALDLCPAVLLGAGRYHLRAGLRIVRNGTRLLGTGVTQTDQGENPNGTEIVCSSPDDTILQVGSSGAGQPEKLVEAVQLRDFSVRRSVAPAIPPAGFAGAIGIALRWCVNCHIDRVFSIDSARGWFFYGTIENYVRSCSALRGIAGARPDRDVFIGFHLDYNAPLAANGGNASLYLDHCRAFGGYGRGTPALQYSAGLRTDGGWVDLYVNAFETGTLQYGIHGNGDGYGQAVSFRTEDLIITNCVLDPGTLASIRIEAAGAASAVQIANCYCAVTASGTSIVLRDLAGSVTLTSNQCIIGAAGGTGLSAVGVNNLRASGNIYTKLKQPIYLERVTGFHVTDTIQALDTGNDYPGVGLIDCARGKIDCIVTARPGALTAGVEFKRVASRRVEVSCTAIDAAGAPKLVDMGKTVGEPGPFGAGNLATGIVGRA